MKNLGRDSLRFVAGLVSALALIGCSIDSGVSKDKKESPSTTPSSTFAVTLSSAATSPHNISAISVTVDFGSEVIAGSANELELTDFAVTNGSVSNLVDLGSGTKFTVDFTPSASGSATIRLPKYQVENADGKKNTASNTLGFTIDGDGPTLAVTGPVTSGNDLVYTVTYTGATTINLQDTDITVGGTAGGSCTAVVTNGTQSPATITLSGCTGPGTVNISILADTAQDALLNQAAAYGPSSNTTLTANAFGVTLSSLATSPHNASAISVTVDFGSEVISGSGSDLLEVTDFQVANGSISNLLGAGSLFTFDLTPAGAGTTTVKLLAGTVKNASSNTNDESNTLSFTIDTSGPTIVISGPVVSGKNFVYTVTYTDATTINLQNGDITLGGTDQTGCTKAVTNGTQNPATVTISGCKGDGTVNFSMAANTAQDAVGNQAGTANSADATVKNAFIARFDTTKTSGGSSNNLTVTLPLNPYIDYNNDGGTTDDDLSIDWGDGSPLEYINDGTEGTHTYASSGVYDIKIVGNIYQFQFSNSGDRNKILDIKQWGVGKWWTMQLAFYGCQNLQISATDAPDLSDVTDFIGMFAAATSFNSNINHWDVSTITDMGNMFSGASAFNQPLGNWNVSSVTKMNYMFSSTPFNQDISSWNTSNVTNMSGMFDGAAAFNQPLAKSGSSWDTSKVTDMTNMFFGASEFNQDISSWEFAPNLSDMSQMFQSASKFNKDLTAWSAKLPTGVGHSQFDLGATAWEASKKPVFP